MDFPGICYLHYLVCTDEDAHEGTCKLADNVDEHLFLVRDASHGGADCNRGVDMATGEGGGDGDAQVQEAAYEEGPVRIGLAAGDWMLVLADADAISQDEGA